MTKMTMMMMIASKKQIQKHLANGLELVEVPGRQTEYWNSLPSSRRFHLYFLNPFPFSSAL
jgi:hypothetical protein